MGHHLPAGQFAHVAAEVAPTVLLKVPDAHWDAPWPEPRQYQPTGHCSVLTVEPGPQKMPAEHVTQAGEAAEAE